MSQNDFDLANQVGANFRADINAAFQALASNSSGTGRPATCYAWQCWVDTDYGTNQCGIYRIVDPGDASLDTLELIIDTATGQRRLPANMTTTLATATQYAKLRTYSFPAANDVSAVSTLLLTPIGDSAHYQPIEIEVIAKQGTSGLDTTDAQINVIRNSGEAVLYNDFDLVTAATTNGTDIMLWMRSVVAAKYAVQVIAEEFETGVSVTNHDGATWSSNNPLTTPAPAASVTSTWAGSGELVPTLGSGWSAGSGCFYKKTVDGQVIVHLFASGSGTATEGTALFTLPSGFRPKLQYHTPLVANSSGWNTVGLMYVLPTGIVKIYGVSAASPTDLTALAIFEAA